MSSAAGSYLEEVYQHLSSSSSLTATILSSLSIAKSRVVDRLFLTHTTVARRPADVTSYIQRKKDKETIVEDNIRQKKLREAMRLKEELEGKLGAVSQTIQRLTPEPRRSSQKLDLRNKEARLQFFSEESERRREAAELVGRMRKEQEENYRRREARKREEEERHRDWSLEEIRKKEEEVRKQSEEKAKHISEIQSHIQQRKAAMEAQRRLEAAELDRLRDQTYANEKLLQDFHKRILLPIEQQRSEILSKNKQLHKPLAREELEQHAKRHDEDIRLLAAHRYVEKGTKSPEPWVSRTSKFTVSVLSQAKKDAEEREAAETEKRKLMEKRKKYGELVKAFYPPTLDPLKQRELELIKERLKVSPKTAKSERKSESPISFRPRKFRPNPMLPPAKGQVRTPSPIDFLAAQRRLRDNYESDQLPTESAPLTIDWAKELKKEGMSPSEIARKVQAKAQLVEKEAQRKTLLLSRVSPANTKGIDVGEQLDEAVIQSIRAKLSIITDGE